MIERFALILLLSVVAVVAYRLFRWRQLQQAVAATKIDSLLADFRPGIPAIVYFTTPFCGPCQTQQTPALKAIESELGDRIQIFRVDATEDAEAAERWGVFSVPTTFVLDGTGQPLEVNHGVANADKLRRQLHGLAKSMPHR